jgi:electron transport complex protein RnfA
MHWVELFLGAMLVNNIVLARFLGVCPFLGVSSRMGTARGMGLAVIFVITLASSMTWLVYYGILEPLGITYLSTMAFILVIASVVQFVEIVMKKFWPALYRSLGIFLPLITTNCAVLGVAVLNVREGFGFVESLVHSVGTASGFMLALILFAGLRERMAETARDVPEALRGLPLSLVTAGLMALAFMGFQGIF